MARKIILTELLREYIMPKPGNKVKVDMAKIKEYARSMGPFGVNWIKIINDMLRKSGDNTLYVHNVKGDSAIVSQSQYGHIWGTVEIPIKAIKSIVMK